MGVGRRAARGARPCGREQKRRLDDPEGAFFQNVAVTPARSKYWTHVVIFLKKYQQFDQPLGRPGLRRTRVLVPGACPSRVILDLIMDITSYKLRCTLHAPYRLVPFEGRGTLNEAAITIVILEMDVKAIEIK